MDDDGGSHDFTICFFLGKAFQIFETTEGHKSGGNVSYSREFMRELMHALLEASHDSRAGKQL